MQWCDVSAVAVLQACQALGQDDSIAPQSDDGEETARRRYAFEEANAIASARLWSKWDDDQVGLSLADAGRLSGY